MFSRLSRLLPALAVASAGVLLLATGAPAQQPAPAGGDLKAKQEENAKLFKDFTDSLARLANRLDKSDRPEDKEKAKTITKAIELASKENVSGQFTKLVQGLAQGKTEFDLSKLQGDEAQLRAMLKQILDILITDDESALRKAEIARLEAILKAVKEAERRQRILQSITEGKTGDPKKIADSQNQEADRVKDIVKSTNDKKDDKPAAGGGDKKDDRAEAKPEGKPGDPAGEAKGESGEPKGEGKEGMGKEGQEGKEGMGGEGKGAGEGKEGMGGEGKPGEGKEGMGKEGKPGEGKGAGEGKEGQPGGNPMDPKNPMGSDPKNPMGGDAKPGQGQGKGEGKGQGQGKGEGKPSDAKGGEGKGSGEGKGGGEPKPGQGGEGKPGQGKPGQGGEGKPGQGGEGQPGQPGQPKPPQQQTPGRKELEEAYPKQQDAAKKIGEDNRKEAGKDQDKAGDALKRAIAELEKRLKQLREEETKKLLAALEGRIAKMLLMQIEVYEATKAIDGGIKKNNGEVGAADRQKSLTQGDKQGEIVAEADKAMKLMENEGSAVAFATVLNEVRQDMIAVQRRLSQVYVDKPTQVIEEQIIAMLKDMQEALKKAQKEQEQQPPKPPGESGQQKPQNKKLLDLIAELKLIRSLQKQVNDRTEMYGKSEGKGGKSVDQSKDPLIQAELKMLATKQAKLQEMIDKIANKGDE